MSELVIGGVNIEPGESREVRLFIAKQYDFTDAHIPVKVIRGKDDGPVLFICAAVHGDEVNGVEIIRRLLKHKALKIKRGTLIAVPIVNVFGFNNLSRYLPDRRDLNRCFPGLEQGSLASHIAHLFVREIVSKATVGIDLHTGSRYRTNLPQVRACLDDPKTMELAQKFDVPLILDAEVIKGSLREVAFKQKIPLIVYEGGEPLRHDETTIRCGITSVLLVMQALGMIKDTAIKGKRIKSFIAHGSHWVRASHSGVVTLKRRVGSFIKKDDILCTISDPMGNESIEVRAKRKGVIICNTELSLVNKGDALFHVATFEKTHGVQESIELFDDKFDYEER